MVRNPERRYTPAPVRPDSTSSRRSTPTRTPSERVTRTRVRFSSRIRFVQSGAWPDRARPWRHRLLNAHVLVGTERASAEQAEDDAFVVCDDADVPVCRQASGNICNLLIEPAGRRIGADDACGASAAVVAAFEWESERAPVGLTCSVVVDAREADALEPPRGSWTHVSLVVVAIDDHRPHASELAGRLAVERLQREVDCAWEVFVLIRRRAVPRRAAPAPGAQGVALPRGLSASA